MNGCPFQRGRSIPEFAFDRGACLAGEGKFSTGSVRVRSGNLVSYFTVREFSGK